MRVRAVLRVRGAAFGGFLTMLAACGGGAAMEAPPPEPVLDPVAGPTSVADGSESPAAPSCQPSDATLAASDALPSGSTDYHLVMVRGDATRRPAWVEGRLVLEARPAELRSVGEWTTPLHGTADIDIARVGAHDTGALDSSDPRAPGVLVLRSDGVDPTVLLRLGAASNRTDETAFDGAFTVLSVHAIHDDGFAGSWRSGSFGNEVRGHFCASVSGS